MASSDVLSLHFLASSLQLYLKKAKGSPAAVVAWLDAMEAELGSPEAFRAVFPVLLVDLARGLPEHLHLGLVGVDDVALEQEPPHPGPQPGQPLLPGPHHPVRHALARHLGPQAPELLLHAVQRQRVRVLAVHHVGDERRGRERAPDRRLRHRRANDGRGRLRAGRVGLAARGAPVDGALVALRHQVGRHHAQGVRDLDVELLSAPTISSASSSSSALMVSCTVFLTSSLKSPFKVSSSTDTIALDMAPCLLRLLFGSWSFQIIPMAWGHVRFYLDVFSCQFAKETLRYRMPGAFPRRRP